MLSLSVALSKANGFVVNVRAMCAFVADFSNPIASTCQM